MSSGGGSKRFQHPEVGPMTLTFEGMTILHTDGQRLVSYQAPPGTPDHRAMSLLDADPAVVDGIEGRSVDGASEQHRIRA